MSDEATQCTYRHVPPSDSLPAELAASIANICFLRSAVALHPGHFAILRSASVTASNNSSNDSTTKSTSCR